MLREGKGMIIISYIVDGNIQGVSKIQDITSGMSSSYVDNKNSLYQHRSGNAWFPS
jgi:hypothetical protein